MATGELVADRGVTDVAKVDNPTSATFTRSLRGEVVSSDEAEGHFGSVTFAT